MKEGNMVDYFFEKYGLDISHESDQPLLIVHQNKKEEDIYLPVSLCYEASLPKDFTKDAFKMREISNYRISHPAHRHERISKFISLMTKNQVF